MSNNLKPTKSKLPLILLLIKSKPRRKLPDFTKMKKRDTVILKNLLLILKLLSTLKNPLGNSLTNPIKTSLMPKTLLPDSVNSMNKKLTEDKENLLT